MVDTLQYALRYASAGYSVIPIREGTKIPLVPWQEFQNRRATESEIRSWYAQHPNAGVAIVTGRISGVVVLDVDTAKGASNEGIPETGTVIRTGSGGYHYFYRYPTGAENVPNRVGIRPYIDVRGDGGYVVTAPSMHACGRRYSVEKSGAMPLPPPYMITGEGAPSAPPKPSPEYTAPDGWISELLRSGAREGGRNDAIARLAGYCAGKGIALEITMALAESVAAKSDGGIDSLEIRRTVESVYRTHKRRAKDTTEDAEKVEAFELVDFASFAREYADFDEQWLIPGWLPRETIGLIVAPPESFKTWLELDLAISVATGKPFMGVQPEVSGPVLVFQQEDPPFATVQRMQVIHAAKVGGPTLRVDGEIFEWESPAWHALDSIKVLRSGVLKFKSDQLMDQLEEVIAEIRPRLVIIDPLYMSANQDNYMADAIADMKRLKDWRTKYHLAVLIAHHTRKGAGKEREGLLGSQYLNAFLETSWQIRKVNETEHPDRITLRRTFKNTKAYGETNLHFDISTEDEDYGYKVTAFDAGLPEDHLEIVTDIEILLSSNEHGLSKDHLFAALERPESVAGASLQDMIRAGKVVNENGKVKLTHLSAPID